MAKATETALRHTAKVAYSEGFNSWAGLMSSGADMIALLEAKLAASEAAARDRTILSTRLDEARSYAGQLEHELAAERAARVDAERVAVWTGKRARVWMTSIEYQVEGWHRSRNTMAHDGTDESIYRALRRAEAEAKADHG